MAEELSVIIPVYKEENRIIRCIEESLFFFRNNKHIKNFEIIFVADKSGDKTIELIQQYLKKNKEIQLIINETRQQKGGSVKIGVSHARYSLLLYYDTDLSTPLYEVNECLEFIQQYDLIIGSRGLKESHIQKKYFGIFLSHSFSLLKFLVLGLHIKDTQCGFKMFRKSVAPLFEKQSIKSSCFDVELLYLAQKNGFTIKEKPITWIDSDMSNFQTWKIIPTFLKDLFAIRINSWKGFYDKNTTIIDNGTQ